MESREKHDSQKKRRRGRAARKTARKGHAAAEAGCRIGEVTVGTFSVCTLVFDGASAICHSEVVLEPCQALGCDVFALQEACRAKQSGVVAAGYTVYHFGHTSGARGTTGHHGVGFAIKESFLEKMGGQGTVVGCIRGRLMEVRLGLESKSNGAN